jgi:hypothetical protein
LQTADESAAGVTPTNVEYPPGNLLRYVDNAVPGTTDLSTGIQAWITLCADYDLAGYAPAGHYAHASTITQKVAGSRLTMRGDGRCAQSDFTGDAPKGTVFEYTGSTGNGWEFGDGVTTNVRGFKVEDMSFWGNTTGDIMSINTIQDGNVFSNLFFGNNGTGGGLIIFDMWVSGVKDIYCVGVGSSTSLGTGFQWANDGNAAGIGYCLNVNGKGFSRGIVLGTEDSTGLGIRSINANVQGISCDEGVVLGSALTGSYITVWTENNDTCGLRVFNQAGNNDIRIYCNEPSATEANIVIGKSGGTAIERTVSRTRINGGITGIDTAGVGIQVYGASAANNNILDRCSFTPESAGNGTGIAFDVNSEQGWEVNRPEFNNLATDITGATRITDYIASNGSGLQTLRRPVAKTPLTFGTTDATPSVATGDIWKTADTTTITDFDDGTAGQEITVISKHAMTFSMAGDLAGSSVDIATNSGDITKWLCEDGTVWRLVAFVDSSVDNSGGA